MALRDGHMPIPHAFGAYVVIQEGRPISYNHMGFAAEVDEPAIADRIFALTGFRVTFGKWFEIPGDPREPWAEVPLVVVE